MSLILDKLAYIPPFLFVLTIVVFVHEMGHFLVARWCGVAVKVFSIGFGREIVGFDDKHGTRWRISWIPLGGYVKFMDDENSASVPSAEALQEMTPEQREGSFHLKSLPARAAVVVAGPMANFIFSMLFFACMFMFVGVNVTLPRADKIISGGAAEKAGFKTGDVVKTIDGLKIKTFNDMQRIVSGSADKKLVFVISRDGKDMTLSVVPERKETTDPFGNKMRIGLIGIQRVASKADWVSQTYDPLTALGKGFEETKFIIVRTMSYLYEVVTGRESADQLGGPLRIAELSKQVSNVGILPLLNLIGVLSVSIGLLNLFPIPLLDGGHLMFYAIEGARGRPLSDHAQEIGFRIGMAFVIMLTVFVFWNDLTRLLG